MWRILRTLDRHGVPATIFCSGRAGEFYPDVIKEHEPMGLLRVAFHSRFAGRPLMTAMFDKLLTFLRAQADVHFPGHNAIAKWVLERDDNELSYASRFFA